MSPVARPSRAATAGASPAPRRLSVRFPSGWSELDREIRACTRCPLHQTRSHAVVYRGAPHPQFVFVGEAPGAEEDRQGRPFVGRAGRRLDAAIEQAALPPSAVGILNLIKCRPPGNRFDRSAAKACDPYLQRQLAYLRPSVLVPLGAHALRALDPDAPPISEASGHLRPRGPFDLFPLVHPAAAFRSRRWAARWEEDVGRFATFVRARGYATARIPS